MNQETLSCTACTGQKEVSAFTGELERLPLLLRKLNRFRIHACGEACIELLLKCGDLLDLFCDCGWVHCPGTRVAVKKRQFYGVSWGRGGGLGGWWVVGGAEGGGRDHSNSTGRPARSQG